MGIILSIIGVLIGALITWLVSMHFYKKASRDLSEETSKLKRINELTMYKLQYPDAETEIKRDEKGDIVGLIVKMKANLTGSGDLKVKEK